MQGYGRAGTNPWRCERVSHIQRIVKLERLLGSNSDTLYVILKSLDFIFFSGETTAVSKKQKERSDLLFRKFYQLLV